MEWKETHNNVSSDGINHHITLELWANFEPSKWNKNTESPIITLKYWDHKIPKEPWAVCQLPTIEKVNLFCKNGKGCDCPMYYDGLFKRCTVEYCYFQRMPNDEFNSGIKGGTKHNPNNNYDEFTIQYAKTKAIQYFQENIYEVLNQLPTNDELLNAMADLK